MTMTEQAERKKARANARRIAAERQKRERSWKRWILAGAFASFIAVAGGIATQEGMSGNALSQPTLSVPAEEHDQPVAVPRVRTRTS